MAGRRRSTGVDEEEAVTISNESGPGSGWDELFQLQAQYTAKLTEETLKYLRGLQAALSPRPPGTVVKGDDRRVAVAGGRGARLAFEFTLENRQRVHTPVAPSISPLIGDDGTTWYPAVSFEPAATLMAPDEVRRLAGEIDVPVDIEPGVYRGSIVLHGFVMDGVPLEVTVADAEPAG
jgi:hypothetical protein